ncbi:MAG: carboxypeptidase-like regulatory domain-containing protein [Fulvivirga sp.]|uniref:carboxypeptidase-like regulatory domain-containing protein n=1 Tax=Fulvivirga sp. TaxID=1931237 RepID=UPI0032EEB2E8
MRLILFLALLVPSSTLYGQDYIKAKVIDEETGKGVPFVNIGVKELGIGTVSNSNGQFTLELKDSKYPVIFSSIGYEVIFIPYDNLKTLQIIKLKPKTEMLEEVVVTSKKYNKDVILGYKLNKKGHSVGFGSRALGTEIGAHCKIKKETFLKTANFTLNFTGTDSLLFRVNIYKYNQGTIGDKLVDQDIIIRTIQQKGTITIDLEPFNIIVKDDILLALEWIEDDNGKGNSGIMFRAKKSASSSNLYTKQTSFAPFLKLSQMISGAPLINIGFYLEAEEVD